MIPGQAIRNTRSAIVPSVIREIEIWRVAVLMVNRYADEAEANSFMRAILRFNLISQLTHMGPLSRRSEHYQLGGPVVSVSCSIATVTRRPDSCPSVIAFRC